MKLLDFWNYRADPVRPRTLRENALRWLAGFFALMLLCTVVSRAADSLTIAEVELKSPDSAQLTHTVRANGRFSSVGEQPISAMADALVQSVAVQPGAKVRAGDVLFTLDAADLAEKLQTARLELQKTTAELAAAKENLRRADEKRGLDEARAQEDYDFAVSRSRNKLIQLGEDRRLARQELRDYAYDNDIDEDLPDSEQDPQYISLKRAYRQAQRNYEDAENSQSEEMAKAERSIEDAGLSDVNSSIQTLGLDSQLKQLQIAKLQTAANAGGVIAAPFDGVVTSVSISPGRHVSGSEAPLLMSGEDAGLRFTAEISDEDARRVSPGDEVKIQPSGANRTAVNAKLETVEASDTAGMQKITASVPAGAGALGAAASAEILQKSPQYPVCVPLSAVRSDGITSYVLVLREKETALGTEQVAERVDVTILERSETRAAVSGALARDDQVIVSSGKPVSDKDRVRPVKS